MPLDPQALYSELGHLIEKMPDLSDYASRDVLEWKSRVAALLDEMAEDAASGFNVSMVTEAIGFKSAADNVALRSNQLQMQTIAFRVLARLERSLPMASRGAFIPAGAEFSALDAVARVLSSVHSEVLFVDPYADMKILSDYAVLAGENIKLKILSDEKTVKPNLKPAFQTWTKQYPSRPLEVRLAPARKLHDRSIIVDNESVYLIGQSFNALATRSPTTISRMDDPDSSKLKREAYLSIWQNAEAMDP